jgi:uncharacterized membrane protein YjjP (DUF1212 family)
LEIRKQRAVRAGEIKNLKTEYIAYSGFRDLERRSGMDEEKDAQEKEQTAAEKKNRHDPYPRITGGLILILLGVLFLLATLDYLSWGDWWAYFLFGLGCILILEALVRSTSPAFREHMIGRLIGGIVLVVIGASFIFGMTNWWPLIIIAVGVVLVISTLWRPKKSD